MLGPTLLALALFIALFLTQGVGLFDFWWGMSSILALLVTLGMIQDRAYRADLRADLRSGVGRKALLGLASAVALYGVFWVGGRAATTLFAFAGQDIQAVYAFRGGAGALRLILLMALVIGPGEELFWRGFVQRRLMARYGVPVGLAAATALYTGVHIATGNLILVLAALVCGLFWGALYARHRSLLLNAVSHTAWDLAAFVFFPFQ